MTHSAQPAMTCHCPDCTGIPYGCQFCSMTGYEDYPSCKVACRIAGHQKSADTLRDTMYKASLRPWTRKEGNCPFCKQPNCEHWMGNGWRNPLFWKGVQR